MKKIVILGCGESGIGAAILAKSKKFNVFISDINSIKNYYKTILVKNNILFEEKKHNEKIILGADLIIKSPGISHKEKLIQKIKFNKIKIISEIEFASYYAKGKIIAITGTNGKTTTASLVYYILKKSGLNVGLSGNIGNSFALQVFSQKFDYYVVEISSFQLDDSFLFKPYISTILNLSPDHLDEYNNKIINYYNSKFKIMQKIDKNDYFIFNKDDINIAKKIKNSNINTNIISFSIYNDSKNIVFLKDDKIIININPVFEIEIKKVKIKGIHNIINTIVAVMISKLLKINNKHIEESLKTFKGIKHRLEKITTINGVTFINDSKSTNINSLYYALLSIKKPIILILGGIDKGNKYDKIFNLVIKKVKKMICLGLDNKKIKNVFQGKIEIIETNSIKECINISYNYADFGDTVLLSPACSSFDLFKNFEDRGKQFEREVINLKKQLNKFI